MGVGAGTLVSPIYISEISPASERGMLMSAYQVFVQAGALVGFWIAYFAQAVFSDHSAIQWQIAVSIQVVVGGLLLVGSLIIPESPRYLAQQNQHQTMEDSLCWLRRRTADDPDLIAELTEIDAAAHLVESLQRESFVRELGKPDIRRRLGVGVGLMVAQNMVGLNALNYYSPVIMCSAGFTTVSSSLFLTGVFGLVKLLSSLAFMFKLVNVKGNRFWLQLGSAICGLSMLVLAGCVHALPTDSSTDPSSPETSTPVTATGIVAVTMIYIIAFSFGVSLGPISWNVCSEIFPLRINSKCCAITTCTQWLFQVVIAGMTPPLLASLGWWTYVIYGGFCFLSWAWVWVAVPETRGVGVGKAMDEVFGVEDVGESEETALMEEVSETTGLLAGERRRRSSLTNYA